MLQAELYLQTRHATERICQPLETEDLVVQPEPEVSPLRPFSFGTLAGSPRSRSHYAC